MATYYAKIWIDYEWFSGGSIQAFGIESVPLTDNGTYQTLDHKTYAGPFIPPHDYGVYHLAAEVAPDTSGHPNWPTDQRVKYTIQVVGKQGSGQVYSYTVAPGGILYKTTPMPDPDAIQSSFGYATGSDAYAHVTILMGNVDFYIDTTHVGPGTITVTPSTHQQNNNGESYNFSFSCQAGYQIDSITLDGVSQSTIGFTVVGSWTNRTIVVTTSLIPPTTVKINGSITTIAPSVDDPLRPINQGGSLTGTGGLDLTSHASGTITGSSSNINVGDSYMVTAVVNEMRSRIVAFTVDGVNQLGISGPVWYANAFGIAASHDVAASMTVMALSDIVGIVPPPVWYPATPTPPVGWTPPVGSGWPTTPPPTGSGWPTTDPWSGSPSYPVTGSVPGGSGGTGDGAGGSPGLGGGGSNPGGVGPLPTTGYVIPFGADWTSDSEPRGLIVRWRDNGGKWSKEQVNDWSLGKTGDTRLDEHAHSMGRYRTRQYEIVMVGAVPFGLFSIEESVKVLTEVSKKGSQS